MKSDKQQIENFEEFLKQITFEKSGIINNIALHEQINDKQYSIGRYFFSNIINLAKDFQNGKLTIVEPYSNLVR